MAVPARGRVVAKMPALKVPPRSRFDDPIEHDDLFLIRLQHKLVDTQRHPRSGTPLLQTPQCCSVPSSTYLPQTPFGSWVMSTMRRSTSSRQVVLLIILEGYGYRELLVRTLAPFAAVTAGMTSSPKAGLPATRNNTTIAPIIHEEAPLTKHQIPSSPRPAKMSSHHIP